MNCCPDVFLMRFPTPDGVEAEGCSRQGQTHCVQVRDRQHSRETINRRPFVGASLGLSAGLLSLSTLAMGNT